MFTTLALLDTAQFASSPWGREVLLPGRNNTGFSCCREFIFQHNGLLYSGACVSSKAYTVLFAVSDKRKGRHFSHDTPQTLLLISLQSRNRKLLPRGIILSAANADLTTYCSNRAIVRPTAIIPSPSPTPTANI